MKKHQENRWSSRNVPCTLQFAGKFALYLGRFERSRIVCVYDILYMYIYIYIYIIEMLGEGPPATKTWVVQDRSPLGLDMQRACKQIEGWTYTFSKGTSIRC